MPPVLSLFTKIEAQHPNDEVVKTLPEDFTVIILYYRYIVKE